AELPPAGRIRPAGRRISHALPDRARRRTRLSAHARRRPGSRARVHHDGRPTQSPAATRRVARRAARSDRSRDGPPPTLFPSPFLDLSVVARKQNLRNVPAAKLGGTRVVGILQTTL